MSKTRPPRRIASSQAQEPTENLVDVTPLKKAVNPFKFGAAVMRQYLKTPGVDKEALTKRIGWLMHLGQRIETTYNMPIQMMALTAAALDHEQRSWMREVLEAIDAEVEASTRGRRRRSPVPMEEEVEEEEEIEEDEEDVIDVNPSAPDGA